MRINWIELVEFKRMSLNNIRRFKLTPSQRIQLVLGTNGSGKSSLMGELSPMPAIAANYGKEGSKTISITHLGHEYVLASHFSPSQKHSFLKNGTELNEGGTISVQIDLVKSEFGYRKDIHELMTGQVKFSQMKPNERRRWFTELCETNYDYAIGVYNKLAERSRDTSGALKLAKKRIVVETSKVMSTEEVDKINQQIQALLREIDLLYNSRVEESRSVHDIEREQRELENEVMQAASRLQMLRQSFLGRTLLQPEVIQEQIDAVKHELTRTSAQVDVHSKSHTELKEKYDAFLKTGAVGVDDLRKKYTELTVKKDELQGRKKLKLYFDQPLVAQAALSSIYEVLTRVFHELPANEDRHLSSAKLQEAKEKEFQLKDKMGRANNMLEQFRHQKAHLEQQRDGQHTECPSCKHRWIPGWSEGNYTKVMGQLEQGGTFLEKCLAEEKALKEVIDANHSYGELFREFTRCTRTVPVLQPFWDLLQETIYSAPMHCFRLLEQLQGDLDLDAQCLALDAEVIKNNQLIELAIKANDADMGKIGERLEALENELGQLAQKTGTLRTQLQLLQNDLQRVIEFKRLGERIAQYQEQLGKGVNDLVRATRNEVINSCLQQLQIELAQKQNVLNEINVQRGIISDLQTSIDRLTKEEEALKILVSSLSPHEGLIAEGLLGFIRSFVRKMNMLIRKMWTYRLEVQDCSVDSEGSGADLDYKFPMLVGDSDLPVPDVEKGSGGQREIIDLTFKIVAMQYLKLSQFPLFADELGHAMDVEHKAATVNLIKYLMDHSAFSQLYMVSHDFVQYGALTNLETCVLCESNIVVPGKFNEHVEMS